MDKIKFKLYDEADYAANDKSPAVHGEIDASGASVDISVTGYGTAGMEPGYGPIAMLEYWGGKLRLIVFADITQEEPTHIIDLSGSRESLRPPEVVQ